jgi:hypothetical protein
MFEMIVHREEIFKLSARIKVNPDQPTSTNLIKHD